jgi:hypothetical protein
VTVTGAARLNTTGVLGETSAGLICDATALAISASVRFEDWDVRWPLDGADS